MCPGGHFTAAYADIDKVPVAGKFLVAAAEVLLVSRGIKPNCRTRISSGNPSIIAQGIVPDNNKKCNWTLQPGDLQLEESLGQCYHIRTGNWYRSPPPHQLMQGEHYKALRSSLIVNFSAGVRLRNQLPQERRSTFSA